MCLPTLLLCPHRTVTVSGLNTASPGLSRMTGRKASRDNVAVLFLENMVTPDVKEFS